jgi:hypothetical protein
MVEQCFALKRNNKGRLSCQATTTSICSGMDTSCPFYKTMGNMLIGREDALKRIATLPEYIQEKISKQYYKGEKPWGKYAEEYAGADGSEAFGTEREGT